MSFSAIFIVFGSHFECLILQHKNTHNFDTSADSRNGKSTPKSFRKICPYAHFYLEMPTSSYLNPFSQIWPSL